MTEAARLPNRVHVIGAGGAGMSGLAKLLSQLGHTVTGSDLKPGRMFDSLPDVGVRTWIGHRPEEIAGVDLVVVSSAVPDTDPEIQAARDAGVRVWERPRLLAALTRAVPTIGFAGTHGKTTSTALAVAALRGIGMDPSFLVGGEMIGLNTGAHRGVDDLFVLEADEAFGTFRHLELHGILVTNIEADHLDYYGTLAALEDAFAQVVGSVNGPRVGCIDDAGVRRLNQRVALTTYGFAPDAEWRIHEHLHSEGGQRFTLTGPGTSVEVSLEKPGTHLASNAAGVLAFVAELGYDVSGAARAVADFAGVRRRYEIRARVQGVTIVDDYAHHPTEVAASIQAASFGTHGNVVVVFQPHRYTRTADLGPQFGGPLALAHHTVVTDVYSAGEQPIIGVSGRIVAAASDAAGGSTTYIPSISDVVSFVAELAQPGDTILLLGAGDITTIAMPIALAIEDRS
ncbi:MAG: UDP-N-acetylmuramate--L-alanine ligase [Actinomycetota bacterium]|nr:UDP-N-acetylmuramate--L-alanine ligase [Actinomycetota bacterium]